MIRFFQRGVTGNKKVKRRQLRAAMGLPPKPGRHERICSNDFEVTARIRGRALQT